MINTFSNIVIGFIVLAVLGVVGYQSSLPKMIQSFWSNGGVRGAQQKIVIDFLNRPSAFPEMKPAYEMDSLDIDPQVLTGINGGGGRDFLPARTPSSGPNINRSIPRPAPSRSFNRAK